MAKQNYINHIALVLDGSSSMQPHAASLIKVSDELIAFLAKRSTQLDQETRVTVYVFKDDTECLVYEKDVLRLPSISTLYKAQGNTALIKSVIDAIDDLALQPEKYGEHAFLLYVLTDGEENVSHYHNKNGRVFDAATLASKLNRLPDHWTPAIMVPNSKGRLEAKRFGFPAGNIEIWDTTSQQGLEEAIAVATASVDTFMTTRAATGQRGTKNLFAMNTAAATASTVKTLGVKPLERGKFVLINPPAQDKTQIKDMVTENGLAFRLGMNYYELRKVEKIQGDKKIALVRKQDAAARKAGAPLEVFVGYEVRDFLGLPGHEVRVGPQASPDFDIFVQSNSNNRHMMNNMRLLVLEPKTV